MTGPLVVAEGRDSFERTKDRLSRAGWRVLAGFDGRPSISRTVLAGPVVTTRDAAAALLAALDGFGVLVQAEPGHPAIIDRLVDDLRRLGPVEHCSDAAPEVERGQAIDPDGLAILGYLAEGHSLGEAAHQLGISRRTADRRLAAAREAIGVTRTTEAIARAARLGLLRPDDGR